MNRTDHGWFVSNSDVATLAACVASAIRENYVSDGGAPLTLYGVPRGGIPAAYAIQHALAELFGRLSSVVDDPDEADIVVDDIVASGRTREHMQNLYPDKPFFALISDAGEDWYIFPWEQAETRDTSAEDIPVRLLQYIGEDPKRGGLIDTPQRFLKAWREWTNGYAIEPDSILKTFTDGAEACSEMILVKDIPVYSHCEHHLAPFFGVAHVAYIPNDRIVGLSKLSRLVDVFSKRLQVQERLTSQVAQALTDTLKPKGVAVSLSCRHMCMESRGIQRQGSTTITRKLTGLFLEDAKVRSEFMGSVE